MKTLKKWNLFKENRENDYNKSVKNIEISDIEEQLAIYTPPFDFSEIKIDSQSENRGIIDSSVWIEFITNQVEDYDVEELEEHFIMNTDFDEVEIVTSSESITFSVNIYNYDNVR